jgi:hypothetical protein
MARVQKILIQRFFYGSLARETGLLLLSVCIFFVFTYVIDPGGKLLECPIWGIWGTIRKPKKCSLFLSPKAYR